MVDATLILLGAEAHELCRVWPNETGVAYRDDPDTGKRTWISYGLKGSGDILGILRDGTFLAIECKTGNAVQQDNQMKFEAMVRRFGGHYLVVRHPQEALSYIRAAVRA